MDDENKNQDEITNSEQKRGRGRPRKNTIVQSGNIKKKRGRKPKELKVLTAQKKKLR